MTSTRSRQASAPAGPPRGGLRALAFGVHLALVAVAAGLVLSFAGLYVRSASRAAPAPLPPTMEEVDWHDPESSVYCVACHRQVAPAVAGMDVQRGHSQNVKLNETQLAAVREMGTVAGPGGTLICMSCHVLGNEHSPYMLADTLDGSRLCRHCHPGHYAQGTPHDLRLSAPDEKNRIQQTVGEGGPCSACHLSHSFAREIMPSPLDPDGYCISCHRKYSVAEGHARTTMEHPESHCLECHNPHDATHDNFLREPGSELCVRCHSDLGAEFAARSHPLGPMDRPMPDSLVPGQGDGQAGPQAITCETCHAVHEAPGRPLLKLAAGNNELCLACHRDELAEQSGHADVARHGRLPVLNAVQQAVVAQWGNPVGPGGELLCVSCHRQHDAFPDGKLLAVRGQSDDLCLSCHPETSAVLGSAHDLRTNAAGETNVRGLTPQQAGACSACHTGHGPARGVFATAGDPTGACATCHREDACGQNKLTGMIDHPQTACVDCHDPHDPRHGPFLAQAPQTLCLNCHAGQASLLGGPHDVAVMGESPRWPDGAPENAGPCLSCHVAHGGERADLFRVGGPQPVGNHDDVCLYCHPDAAWRADSATAALHPQRVAPEHSHVNLALVPTDEAGEKRMGCRTCHDPHGGETPVHLARVAPDDRTESLCLACHADKEAIRLTGHAPDRLAKGGFDVDSCKPCHAMHAAPGDTWGQALSPRFLLAQSPPIPETGESRLPCLACHNDAGPGTARRYITHPPVLMMNITQPGDAGHLPLYNEQGREDPQGQVVCRTCHLSHGRADLVARMNENPALDALEQAALRAHVRSFNAPNVCSACHGAAARSKFLHFHDATLRRIPDSSAK